MARLGGVGEGWSRTCPYPPWGVYTQARESPVTSRYQPRRCTTARNVAAGSVLWVAGAKFPFGPSFDAALFVEKLLAALARNERGDMDYPMHPDLKVGNTFPDFELPDQDGKSQKLSKLIRGFPTVLIFSRGYY